MKRLFTLIAALAVAPAFSVSVAQDIDVYFVAGQSNAGNIVEQNQLNVTGGATTTAPFTLDFGRIQDQASDVNGSSAPGNVVDAHRTNQLDPNQNVNELAQGLFQGNDLGIYGFARNGSRLNDTPNATNSWNVDLTDDLYDQFVAWGTQRLVDLQNSGFTPTLRGLFWFQGEGDVNQVTSGADPNAVNNYQQNLTDLIAEVNTDFSSFIDNGNLAVVAADLRELPNANTESINTQVRAANDSIAALVSNFGVVATTVNADGTGGALARRFGPLDDVHFNNNSQSIIVGRFAEESLRIQAANAVPEPGSAILLALASLGLIAKRRRS